MTKLFMMHACLIMIHVYECINEWIYVCKLAMTENLMDYYFMSLNILYNAILYCTMMINYYLFFVYYYESSVITLTSSFSVALAPRSISMRATSL